MPNQKANTLADLQLIRKIKRLYRKEKMSKYAISKKLKMGWETVDKILKTD